MFEGMSAVQRAAKRNEICEKLGLNNRQTLRLVAANVGNDHSHEMQTISMLGALLERMEALKENLMNYINPSNPASPNWHGFRQKAKKLAGSGETSLTAVEKEIEITEQKRKFAVAFCASGGDVVKAQEASKCTWRTAQIWMRQQWLYAWRDAYVAETTNAVVGRLPRVWAQLFQNAFGSPVNIIRALESDDPTGELEKLSESEQGQVQSYSSESFTDAKGNTTKKVKLTIANRDKSIEMAQNVLGVKDSDPLGATDRPIFNINVMVAGEKQPVAVEVSEIPGAKLLVDE